jgi:acetoin utilization protein AcuB
MSRTTPISEVMTSKVRTANEATRVGELREILREEHVHHLPIVSGGRIVGLVSARDLLSFAREKGIAGSTRWDEDTTTAAELMSTKLVTVRAQDPVEVAIDVIADGRVHSALVLDEGGQLAGIVTEKDLLAYLGS